MKIVMLVKPFLFQQTIKGTIDRNYYFTNVDFNFLNLTEGMGKCGGDVKEHFSSNKDVGELTDCKLSVE